ncbi:MAG: sensor domain-containing diguanylate cyclase [Actinobacteria bacterium]|nr:sensor domain-containing diguanylate cyclase [Actinomycetota bacterium]
MTIARIVIVLATIVALAPITDYTDDRSGQILALASAGYLLLNGVIFAALRGLPSVGRPVLNASLLADAVWAAAVLWYTGSTASPLIFLMYVQSVTVTVLFGWRTGVKLAILHTAGLLANAYGQSQGLGPEAGEVGFTIGFFNLQIEDPTRGAQFIRVQIVVSIVTVWLMAGATAYFSAVRERELRRTNQELSVLRELNTQLERSLDLSDVCQAIATGVVDELSYDRAVVWMAQGGSDLGPAGAAGFAPDEVELLSALRLTVGPGPVGRAVESRRPVLVAREHARPAALADAFEIDSPLVLVPLTTEGRVLGLLAVEVGQPLGRAPRVSGRDLRILATLATEASLALDNARLHAELRDLSVTDALTGVYNHRYFQQRLQEELDRSVRRAGGGAPEPVSLILMDLDLFKKVNDRFGHQAGDELLKGLARLIERVLRSSDVVCRYGGEEFAIILPETTPDQARQVAERMREAIERSNFTASDGRYLGQVTGSFGVATYESGLPSRGDLIREADEALYRGKAAGRNAVVVRDEVVPVTFGIGRRLDAGRDDEPLADIARVPHRS